MTSSSYRNKDGNTTMTQDPSLPTPEVNLEREAKKPHVPSDLHFHFDMPADSHVGAVEAIAHRYCKDYFCDIDYRLTIKTNAQMSDGRIIGYKVSVEARKWIDYGEW